MPRRRPPLLESPRLALCTAVVSAVGLALAWWLDALSGWLAVALHLGLVSLVTYALFGWDKRRAARGLRRIAESNLLLLCWLGGAAGGWLGMRRFRHKTQHTGFRVLVPLALIAQLAVIGWLAWQQR